MNEEQKVKEKAKAMLDYFQTTYERDLFATRCQPPENMQRKSNKVLYDRMWGGSRSNMLHSVNKKNLGYPPTTETLRTQPLLDHLAILKGITDRKQRRECVHALLQRTNLWEVRKKSVSGYSGGMRQRFGVAQALLGAPRLLIVDEPTAGLDRQAQALLLPQAVARSFFFFLLCFCFSLLDFTAIKAW